MLVATMPAVRETIAHRRYGMAMARAACRLAHWQYHNRSAPPMSAPHRNAGQRSNYVKYRLLITRTINGELHVIGARGRDEAGTSLSDSPEVSIS